MYGCYELRIEILCLFMVCICYNTGSLVVKNRNTNGIVNNVRSKLACSHTLACDAPGQHLISRTPNQPEQ